VHLGIFGLLLQWPNENRPSTFQSLLWNEDGLGRPSREDIWYLLRLYLTQSDLMHYLTFNCPWGPLGSPSWRRVANNRHAMSSPRINFPTKLHSNSLWETLLLQPLNFNHLYNRHMNLSLSWQICFFTYVYHKSILVSFFYSKPTYNFKFKST